MEFIDLPGTAGPSSDDLIMFMYCWGLLGQLTVHFGGNAFMRDTQGSLRNHADFLSFSRIHALRGISSRIQALFSFSRIHTEILRFLRIHADFISFSRNDAEKNRQSRIAQTYGGPPP